MSYVVASYVIVLGGLVLYAGVQLGARNRLRKALNGERKRDRS